MSYDYTEKLNQVRDMIQEIKDKVQAAYDLTFEMMEHVNDDNLIAEDIKMFQASALLGVILSAAKDAEVLTTD